MPPIRWASDPIAVIQSFETRHRSPSAGALFAWAASTIESLHYLDDIDQAYDASHAVAGAHPPDVVDVAHARWATSTCVTALDLCAAGLGRSFCKHSGPRELDLASFDVNKLFKRRVAWRAQLPQLALGWVDGVMRDADYMRVKEGRDWLIHSRLNRHFTICPGGPPQRLKLELQSTQLEVRYVVAVARDVATRHVSAFFGLLPNL